MKEQEVSSGPVPVLRPPQSGPVVRRQGTDARPATPGRRIPLVVKLAYTAFLGVLVPFYWATYGPTNFLFFCDMALFLTLAALWLENPLLASMPAVGIVLPQMLWVVDFLGGFGGWHPLGMTEYMFKSSIPLFARGLSLFHGWLPFLLLGLVHRLGYDRRAFWGWTVLSCVLVLTSYFFLPAPPAPADNPNLPVNVNYVFGLSEEAPQTWMAPRAYLMLLLIGLPLVIYLPTHLLFCKLFRPADPSRTRSRA